jgi:hypothetical protein
MLTKPRDGELFYFGLAIDKFAPHKAGRILGLAEVRVNQDGQVKKCFQLEYGDGETAVAEFVEESQGSYELLTAEQGEAKFGEGIFN